MKTSKIYFCLLLGALLLSLGICSAQQQTPVLRFDADTYNFGDIRESDGLVSHIFLFTNTSSAPIIIERVNSDCGCTVPKFSSEPVHPGRQGSIEVVFDPAGYEGRFSKKVTVLSNNGKSRNLLTVEGRVIPRQRSIEETYPFPVGEGLRADNLSVIFDYLPAGSVNSMTIEIINNGANIATIALITAPGGSQRLKVAAPTTLSPGERGTVTFTYDLEKGPAVYGTLSDKVYFDVNGQRSELSVSVMAIAIDDFSDIDPDRVAGCYIEPMFHNFGKVHPGEELSKQLTVSNTGTAPLIIRDVSTRKSTSTDITAGTEIAPGKSLSFSLRMTAPAEYGIATGGATIITNDPERPMRQIRIATEVVK